MTETRLITIDPSILNDRQQIKLFVKSDVDSGKVSAIEFTVYHRNVFSLF